MNEISLLMKLLSKKDLHAQIGASKKEILEKLGIRGKNRSIYFQRLIIELAKYLEPLGMQVRYNPLNFYWYITFESDISEIFSSNPFKGRPSLAATLFCTLIFCLKSSGTARLSDIQKVRKKNTVKDDLSELERLGYLEVIHDVEQVKLTPLIGYKLDIPKLLMNAALKIKD